jgi:hypothetical protein
MFYDCGYIQRIIILACGGKSFDDVHGCLLFNKGFGEYRNVTSLKNFTHRAGTIFACVNIIYLNKIMFFVNINFGFIKGIK